MATFRGQDGSVSADANTVIETVSWECNLTRDELEDSVQGEAGKTYQVGQYDWRATTEVRFDYGDTTGQKLMLDNLLAASPTAIAFLFIITTSGPKQFSGSGHIVNFRANSALGQIVGATFGILPTTALTIAWT